MDIERTICQSIPPLTVYLVVAVSSAWKAGVPLPGEIILVATALMSSRHTLACRPGRRRRRGRRRRDDRRLHGYSIGRRFGMSRVQRLRRRFPEHFGPGHVALARQFFTRWGVSAVFSGRFEALLRILRRAARRSPEMPLSALLRGLTHAGGVVWAGGTTAVVYFLGMAAEKWLSRFSWIALVVAILSAPA